jgi:uncharacterized protein
MRTTRSAACMLLCAWLACSSAWAAPNDRDTELRLASAIGDNETIEQLLAAGADVNAANKFGKTALMMAVEADNLDTVALLLTRGAEINARTVAGCTALTFAAENGHIGITALLIERGANVHDRTRGLGLTHDRLPVRDHRHGRAAPLPRR